MRTSPRRDRFQPVHDAPVRICHALVVGLVLAGCGPVAPSPSSPSSSAPVSVEPSPAPGGEPGPEAWLADVPAPIALTEVAATAHRGAIWVAGGLDGAGHASDRVLVFDPVSRAWSDGPRLPRPIHHAALVSDGTGLFLLGGYTDDGFDRPTDLVVTDLFMPEQEGLETIRELRRSFKGTRILVVTGSLPGGPFDFRAHATLLGAGAALSKPFTREELLGAVHDLLGS